MTTILCDQQFCDFNKSEKCLKGHITLCNIASVPQHFWFSCFNYSGKDPREAIGKEKLFKKGGAEMKLKVRCEKCRYWFPCIPGERIKIGFGECRFNPPMALIYSAEDHIPSQDIAVGYFPSTKINGWCGKFEKEDG